VDAAEHQSNQDDITLSNVLTNMVTSL